MDGDGVGGLFEEDAVVADAKTEETFELAAERLDAPCAGFGVAVDGFEDRHGDVPRNGADLGRDLRLKMDLLQCASVAFRASADLLHGEAEAGDNLLEGDALAAVAEVVFGSTESAAVFFGQILFSVVIDHHFEQ